MKITIDDAVASGRIAEFCRRWNVTELALFGSMARGDYRDDSDVDFLVKFSQFAEHSFGNDLRMEDELRELFGRDVDLVQEHLIANPFRRHNILLDKRIIYPSAATVDQIRDDRPHYDRDIALVWDIVQAGRTLLSFTREGAFEGYVADKMLRLACERLLITISEASGKLSPEFRLAHQSVPWHDIVSLRNTIIHDYPRIEQPRIWEIITVDVPALIREIEPLISGA